RTPLRAAGADGSSRRPALHAFVGSSCALPPLLTPSVATGITRLCCRAEPPAFARTVHRAIRATGTSIARPLLTLSTRLTYVSRVLRSEEHTSELQSREK